jgi:hypothetical protein
MFIAVNAHVGQILCLICGPLLQHTILLMLAELSIRIIFFTINGETVPS